MEKLLDALSEDRGEMEMHGMIINADRGYECIGILKGLIARGMDGVMVLPEHLLRCDPFVGHSHFSLAFADDEVDSEYHCNDAELNDPKDSGSDSGDDETLMQSTTAAVRNENAPLQAAVEGGVGMGEGTVHYDRGRTFIINDASSAGKQCILCSKRVQSSDLGWAGRDKARTSDSSCCKGTRNIIYQQCSKVYLIHTQR